jgi:hypothetical protein
MIMNVNAMIAAGMATNITNVNGEKNETSAAAIPGGNPDTIVVKPNLPADAVIMDAA